MLKAVVLRAAFPPGRGVPLGHPRLSRLVKHLRRRTQCISFRIYEDGRLRVSGTRERVRWVIEHLFVGPRGTGYHAATRWAMRLPIHLRSLTVMSRNIAVLSEIPVGIQQAERCLGDPSFSERVWVAGPAASVFAVFSEGVRARVAGAISIRTCRIREGWVETYQPGWVNREDLLEDELDFVGRLAKSVYFAPNELKFRLQQVAEQDSLRLVRQKALRYLVQIFPEASETIEVLFRTFAGVECRDRIWLHLVEPRRSSHLLRTLARRRWLKASVRAQVLGLLAGLDTLPDDRDELLKLLHGADPEAQLYAAEALGETADLRALPLLYSLANRAFISTELQQVAAWSFGQVQRRLGREVEGALSLCGVSSGRVSLVG